MLLTSRPQDVKQHIQQRKMKAKALHSRSAGPRQRSHGSLALRGNPSPGDTHGITSSILDSGPSKTTLEVRHFVSVISIYTQNEGIRTQYANDKMKQSTLNHSTSHNNLGILVNAVGYLHFPSPSRHSIQSNLVSGFQGGCCGIGLWQGCTARQLSWNLCFHFEFGSFPVFAAP